MIQRLKPIRPSETRRTIDGIGEANLGGNLGDGLEAHALLISIAIYELQRDLYLTTTALTMYRIHYPHSAISLSAQVSSIRKMYNVHNANH